jgi:hypothetical protein
MDTGRSPVAKKTKVEKKGPVVVRAAIANIPTVVPAKRQAVAPDKPSASPSHRKLTREIDPPPRAGDKGDTLSQVLQDVRELKRLYSNLAGSLLVMRRNQDDIKNQLTEIRLLMVTDGSDSLLLPSSSLPTEVTEVTADTPDHHNNSPSREGVPSSVEIVPGDPDHPHTLQGINLSATFPQFDPDYLIVSRGKSCSRRNFAVNLVRYLFTAEEMAQSNCSGTRGKNRLDQERLGIVQRTTLTLWPVEDRVEQSAEWARCIYSIDEACRRLNRPKFRKKSQVGSEEGLLQSHEVERELQSYMEDTPTQL